MKNKFLSVMFTSIIIIISCNNPSNNKTTVESEMKDSVVLSIDHPIENYAYHNNGDTIHLSICDTNQMVAGDLVYRIKEKDANVGKIQGSFQDSLLIADYTFNSEGITSIRQVAFKKINDGFVEGFGEVSEVDGKMIFKDINDLDFSTNHVLIKQ